MKFINNNIRKEEEQIKSTQELELDKSNWTTYKDVTDSETPNFNTRTRTSYRVSMCTPQSTGKTYNCKISTKETKVMAFKRKFPVRTKIIIDYNTSDPCLISIIQAWYDIYIRQRL